MIRRSSEPGKQAVLWLATAFVVLLGVGACTFIIFSTAEDPSSHLVTMAALFMCVIALLLSLSSSRDKNAGRSWMDLWMAMRGKSDPKVVLRIGRKNPPSPPEYGTNAPPTVDSVRDAAASNGTWVPQGPVQRRTRRRRRQKGQ